MAATRALAPELENPSEVEAGLARTPGPGASSCDEQLLQQEEAQDFAQDAFGLAADLAFIRRGTARIAQHQAASADGPIVLLATGTFNPPHRGHLEMIQAAREALGEAGRAVAGTVLVPSADYYVAGKVEDAGLEPSLALPFALRAQLLQATASDLGLGGEVHVSDAEQSRGLFYLQVPDSLARELDGDRPRPRIVFVTGSDRPSPFFNPSRGLSGCVVVPRAGDEEGVARLRTQLDGNPLKAVAQAAREVADLSSTRLRAALLGELSLEEPAGSEAGGEAAEAALQHLMAPSAAKLLLRSLPRPPRSAEATTRSSKPSGGFRLPCWRR